MQPDVGGLKGDTRQQASRELVIGNRGTPPRPVWACAALVCSLLVNKSTSRAARDPRFDPLAGHPHAVKRQAFLIMLITIRGARLGHQRAHFVIRNS